VYGKMMTSFPDPEWRSAVLRLLTAINTTLGQGQYVHPKAALEEHDLVAIGAALATRSYHAEQWFGSGPGSGTPALKGEKPPIDPKSEYRLLALSALRETASRISVRFGGISFEDPFYALLACFNAGQYSGLWLLPKVDSVDRAWQQRSAIADLLAKGDYDPEKVFFRCEPMGQNRTGLPLAVLTVRGELLEKIRQVGRGNIPDATGFVRYALYEFVPAQ
jgi:hypothetical protein